MLADYILPVFLCTCFFVEKNGDLWYRGKQKKSSTHAGLRACYF